MSRNKRIIGHAIYYYRYSTSYGLHLYIEDVFVKAEMRSKLYNYYAWCNRYESSDKGIRAAIFRECAKVCCFFTISVFHNDASPLLDCCCKWLQ